MFYTHVWRLSYTEQQLSVSARVVAVFGKGKDRNGGRTDEMIISA